MPDAAPLPAPQFFRNTLDDRIYVEIQTDVHNRIIVEATTEHAQRYSQSWNEYKRLGFEREYGSVQPDGREKPVPLAEARDNPKFEGLFADPPKVRERTPADGAIEAAAADTEAAKEALGKSVSRATKGSKVERERADAFAEQQALRDRESQRAASVAGAQPVEIVADRTKEETGKPAKK